jgi:hypothetical protein
VRRERHFIVAVRKHNGFATARLGDEFAELALASRMEIAFTSAL